MKNSLNSSAQQPMIVKYVEALHNGIQSQALSRYAIGYILRGTKYIYEGDKRQTLTRGDVFYLGIGHHYIENFRLSGNFWLVSFKISYLCLPLFHETRTTPSCHPSGCAYRQL